MEIHFVHYKENYGSFDEAFDKPDGLMVIGAVYEVFVAIYSIFSETIKYIFLSHNLFEISSQKNSVLDSITGLVKDVPLYKDKAFLFKSITLRSLLPKKLKPFYRYNGSITR